MPRRQPTDRAGAHFDDRHKPPILRPGLTLLSGAVASKTAGARYDFAKTCNLM